MFSLVLSKFLAMRNITSYTAVYLAGVSKSVHWLIDYDKLLIKRGHRNSFIYPLFIHLRNPEGSSTTLFCKHFNSQTYVKSRIMDGATGNPEDTNILFPKLNGLLFSKVLITKKLVDVLPPLLWTGSTCSLLSISFLALFDSQVYSIKNGL